MHRRNSARELFGKRDFRGARAAYVRCLDEIRKDGWCPLARRDLLAILHSNLAETCRQLGQVDDAVRHAVIAIGQSPHWERG